MTLAVLLSALTAWLVMTVFAQQFTAFMVNNRWGMWLIILLPIILTFGINFNATRSPGLCLFLLILTAIVYGITLLLLQVLMLVPILQQPSFPQRVYS
ncbi:membrane protein [Limosilactobacillus reuteri]|uniref:Membrane protein n=1 Tax=Limosilactobacillus reuteri TaxID=1598 RepID=A0A2S1ESJ4_LIMRT|nr:membrane protein [Limosilactobacillus reuteri]